jgi:hypothetical protein
MHSSNIPCPNRQYITQLQFVRSGNFFQDRPVALCNETSDAPRDRQIVQVRSAKGFHGMECVRDRKTNRLTKIILHANGSDKPIEVVANPKNKDVGDYVSRLVKPKGSVAVKINYDVENVQGTRGSVPVSYLQNLSMQFADAHGNRDLDLSDTSSQVGIGLVIAVVVVGSYFIWRSRQPQLGNRQPGMAASARRSNYKSKYLRHFDY